MKMLPAEERRAMAEYFESQSHEYLGAMRMVLAQMGEDWEISDST